MRRSHLLAALALVGCVRPRLPSPDHGAQGSGPTARADAGAVLAAAPALALREAGVAAMDAATAQAPDATVQAPAPTAVASSPTPPATAPAVRLFRGRPEEELLEAMRTRPMVRIIERFSSSTLVFHLDLGDGLEVAFKPDRVGENHWWRHEVAGYRLARVLGIQGRVPPAISRSFPVTAFRGFDRGANFIVTGHGANRAVEGAVLFWMPVLARTHLEEPASRREWTPWLQPPRPIPPEHSRRAEQLGTLVVFDYLQANFDRFNSANIRQDEAGDLVLRDNNRGWFLENLLRLNRGGIEDRIRMSEALYARVREATPEALRRELARDPHENPGGLFPPQYVAYGQRQRALVARVEALIARYGRASVLPW